MPETTDKDSGIPEATVSKQDNPVITEDTVKKMIQSETDKVRTKYSQELAAMKAENDDLRKEQMSAQERKKFEEDKLKDELARKDAELTRREQTLLAVDLLKEKNIPGRLREFVIGKSEAETRANVDKLFAEFQAALNEAVDSRFKEVGKTPGQASSPPASVKTYTRAEVADMGRKAQHHNTPRAEREAILKEMDLAEKEGRIKY